MAELAKKIYIYPTKVVNVESEEKWVQPVLTSNSSVVNGNSFGVSCNSYSSNSSSASGDIYKAFDNDKTGTYWRSGTSTGWFSFYSSVALKVKSIELTPYYSYPMAGTVEVSSNGTTWNKIMDWTNTNNATFTIEVNSDNYYKYYKVNITKINSDVIHLCNIGIDAVTKKVTQESNSSAKLYTTINEVGSQYMMGNVDGVACYASLGSDSDIRATNGKVSKNNKVYSILRTGKPLYNKVSWNTAGTYTFTVPEGVSKVLVTLAGAGGGGGGGATYIVHGEHQIRNYLVAGGAGGKGEDIKQVVSVISKTYQIIVGAGGAGGADKSVGTKGHTGIAPSGVNGGNSIAFNLVAKGGTGGNGGARREEYDDNIESTTIKSIIGSDGISYGNGGAGGQGSKKSSSLSSTRTPATAGADGWCIIEYGGDI